MKKFLTLILTFMIAASLCACGQKGSGPSPEASGQSTSAPNTEAGGSGSETGEDAASQQKQAGTVTVEITPPEGWTKNEDSVLPVHYMKGTASFMVKAEPFSGTTLDDVVKEALEIYKKSFDNVSVQGEVEALTVDEKDARSLTFTCSVSNINMKYLYVYLFAADQTYVITFGDSAENFDSLSADYTAILSNIKFKIQ